MSRIFEKFILTCVFLFIVTLCSFAIAEESTSVHIIIDENFELGKLTELDNIYGDFTGYTLELTCNRTAPENFKISSFNGTLIGNGYSITLNNNNGGLFGKCLSETKISDLTLCGNVNGNYAYIGAFADSADSSEFIHCTNECSVYNSSYYVAGICGFSNNDTKIDRCINKGTITGENDYVAGIACGIFANSEINMCFNYGKIICMGTSNYTAGIVCLGDSTSKVASVYNNCNFTINNTKAYQISCYEEFNRDLWFYKNKEADSVHADCDEEYNMDYLSMMLALDPNGTELKLEDDKLIFKTKKADNPNIVDIEIMNGVSGYSSIYTGKISNVDQTMEYKKLNEIEYLSIPNGKTILDGLEPGIYKIRFKETSSYLPSNDFEFEIKDYNSLNKVDIPISKNIPYTGNIINAYDDNDDYTVSQDFSGLEVGTYSVELQLKDLENSTWLNNNQDDITIEWSISKAEQQAPQIYIVNDTSGFNGLNCGEVSGVDDTMEYKLKSENDEFYKEIQSGETFIKELPAGVYVIRYKESKNYKKSEATEFCIHSINEYEIIKIPFIENTTYTGYDIVALNVNEESPYEIYDLNTGDFESCNIAGRNKCINSGDYSFILRLKENYIWNDGTKTDKTITWSIGKAKHNKPTVIIEKGFTSSENSNDGAISGVSHDMEYKLSNEENYISVPENTILLDNLSSGTYLIRYKEDENHYYSDNTEFVIKDYIDMDIINIPSSKSFTYNGNTVNAFKNNTYYYIIRGGSAINAGNYVAELCLKDNCLWSDGTNSNKLVEWEINKSNQTIPLLNTENLYTSTYGACDAILLNVNDTMEYKRKEQSDFVSIETNANELKLNAGEYEIRYKADNNHYAGSIKKFIVYNPNKIRIDFPKTQNFVYNGMEQLAFNDTINYTVINGFYGVSAGIYYAKISLNDKENTCWEDNSTEDIIITWEIKKAYQESPKITIKPSGESGTIYSAVYGVDQNMEYRVENSQDYHSIGIGETVLYDLPEGKYAIRRKATDNYYASEDTLFEIVNNGEIKLIKVPEYKRYKYNGKELTAFNDTENYIVLGDNKAINQGEYVAILRLNKNDNLRWSDNTCEDKLVRWAIMPAELGIVHPLLITDNSNIVNNDKLTNSGLIVNKTIVCNVNDTMEYRKEDSNDYHRITKGDTTIENLEPGKYYIRFCDTSNYIEIKESEFTIPKIESISTNDSNVVSNFDSSKLLHEFFTEDEIENFAHENKNIGVCILCNNIDDTVSYTEKFEISKKFDNIVEYLDIDLVKIVGDTKSNIHETNMPITITIKIPSEYVRTNSFIYNDFYVVRLHNGKLEILNDIDTNPETITVSTTLFSTYALAFNEGIGPDEIKSVPKTGDNTPLLLYFIVIITSLFGIIILTKKCRIK